MYIGRNNVIEKRKKFMVPCVGYFYSNPPQLVRGEMQYVYDENGKKYLDFFAGVSVMNCGHANPYITQRIIDQVTTLQHVCNIYLTEPVVQLAERLAGVLPGDIDTTFFCNSGSEANEGALLLARLHTGKKEFVAIEGGLHGRTNLTMSVTGIPMWRTDDELYAGVHFIPNPYGRDDKESTAKKSLASLEEILNQHGNTIAAFIAEPIQGNGGITPPPQWYFQEVQKLLKKHNVLMIIDEVQTGFARTGKMFAIEHFDVVPDIMTMAKALGNGVPIAAYSATSHIAASFVKPSASTLGGNPVSCASALAVLDYIEEHDLVKRSFALGNILHHELKKLSLDMPKFVRAVRGHGLMQGIEIGDPDGSPRPDLVEKILDKLLEVGIIVGKNGIGRNVIALQPPLVIEEKDIAFLMAELRNAFDGLQDNV